MPDEYFTITSPARTDLRVKASRFFGFAERVADETAAAEMRARLKKEYHDAAHQPFAYRLADGKERSSDDGEPKGTSGLPILLEIQRAELFDVQVVVVRYFGGTKLGKGGLAKAFGECARQVLQNAGCQKVKKTAKFEIILPAEGVKTAKAIVAEYSGEVESLLYDPQAHLKIVVPESRLQECQKALLDRFGLKISVDV